MWQIDLRGAARKQAFIEKNTVTPILAAKMNSIRGVAGCCGPVSDEFHLFRVARPGHSDSEYIVMGPGCAKALYQMLAVDPPKVFTPATVFKEGQDIPEIYHQLCPFNRELHDAIWLLCMSWRTVPSDLFLSILEAILKNPASPVPISSARSFFSALAKDRRGRDLAKVMADLRKVYPNLRWFSFSQLEKVEQKTSG